MKARPIKAEPERRDARDRPSSNRRARRTVEPERASGPVPAGEGARRSARWFWRILAALCIFGLFRGILILQEYRLENPLAHTPISDAGTYWRWADAIAGGTLVGETPFLSAPLYPYVLGAIRAVGGGLLTVYLLQLFLYLATAVCVGLLGRARFGPAVGAVAAGLYLLLAQPAFSSTRLLATTVQVTLLCLLWFQLIRVERSPSPGAWALAGVVLGLNCLANGPMMLLVVLLGGWALFSSGGWSRRMRRAAAFVAAATLVISAATLHNWLSNREFIPLTANAGINFRLGNAPGSTGIYTPLPGISDWREQMFTDAARVYEQETGLAPSWRKVDTFFLRKGLNEWKAHPLWAVKLAALKFYYFLTGRNHSEIYQLWPEIHKGLADWLRLAPLPVAWLMGPAVVGVALMLRHPGRYRPELLLLLVPLFVVVVFWYSPRFRMPAIPILAVAGAWAIVRAVRWPAHRGCSVAAAAALAVAIGLGRVNQATGLDPFGPRVAQLGLQLGLAYARQGKLDEMMQACREVLDVPEAGLYRAYAHNNLGNGLLMQNKVDDAIRQFREALKVEPAFAEARRNLGNALLLRGDVDGAVRQQRQILEANPYDAEAYHNLGCALAAQGRPDEAIDCHRRALEIEPDLPQAHFSLAKLLQSQGKMDEAIQHLRRAVAGNPEFAEAHYELGLALTLTGRPAEALPHFREAIRLRPGWPLPLNGAAWILATHRAPELSGRDDALRLAQRASELTGHQDAGVLDTLAAAYAAAGQFDRAITTAEEALRLASGNQADDLVHGIRQRLKLYREGKPYRAPTLEQPSGVDAGAASP